MRRNCSPDVEDSSQRRVVPCPGAVDRQSTARVLGEVLHEIWKYSEQLCGKRLKPMLGHLLPYYEQRCGELPAKVREGVLAISAAQIDRVLAPKKVHAGIVNRRTPKTNAAIKALVPV